MLNLLRPTLALVFLLNASCIHTTNYESKPVLGTDEKYLFNKVFHSSSLEVKNLIYSAEKYPLEDFFFQITRGDFKAAFKKARLSYKPSNSDNEILKALLNSGFVPVLIKVKNTSSSRLDISYNEFYLSGNGGHFSSMNPEQLPAQIRQFSPGAVAANVYNVTVVAVVSLMIVLLLVNSKSSSFPDFFGGSREDEKVLNSTQKQTHIDYQKYLIRQKSLAPGEEVIGLVFFSLESMADTDGLTLQYSAALGK